MNGPAPVESPDLQLGDKKVTFNHQVLILTKTNVDLVGGFNPFETYAPQIGPFPRVGVKIKKCLTRTNLGKPYVSCLKSSFLLSDLIGTVGGGYPSK